MIKNVKSKAIILLAKLKDMVLRKYSEVLVYIKRLIREAQVHVMLCIDKEFIKLYWAIAKTTVEKQKYADLGISLIETWNKNIQNRFSSIEEFLSRNIFRMRAFMKLMKK